MKKNEKKNVFDLYSNNEEISNLIKEMKSNQKNYLKLISALQTIGCFDGRTIVEIYDCVETGDNKKVRLWCTDLDDNLYIFYAISNEKKDMLKIIKETNYKTIEYDLALAKKFPITSDNIELTRSGKIYNFKFGRIITDNKSFYSLFMSDDIVFQISGDFDKELITDIIKRMNSFSVMPTLSEFIKSFEIILSEDSCSFSRLSILVFKEGINIRNIIIGDQKINKTKILKK